MNTNETAPENSFAEPAVRIKAADSQEPLGHNAPVGISDISNEDSVVVPPWQTAGMTVGEWINQEIAYVPKFTKSWSAEETAKILNDMEHWLAGSRDAEVRRRLATYPPRDEQRL